MKCKKSSDQPDSNQWPRDNCLASTVSRSANWAIVGWKARVFLKIYIKIIFNTRLHVVGKSERIIWKAPTVVRKVFCEKNFQTSIDGFQLDRNLSNFDFSDMELPNYLMFRTTFPSKFWALYYSMVNIHFWKIRVATFQSLMFCSHSHSVN